MMGDKVSGPGKEGVPQERVFQAIKKLTGFRPMLIPQQLPWQLGVQVDLNNWHYNSQ